jgi:prevent-host-death family protein
MKKPIPYSIPAGKFKATCLKVMDEVNLYHKHVIITKHGKPIAKLVPINDDAPTDFFGCMKGKAKIIGDIISSTDTEWDAEK